ncbi:hypothetical protein CC86DRAFT_388010 [Ophiobolus disseminans]|uniref:Uncharacterized protein n=1 Tax=Ophiobolus disseminans TaxID=1469910 RepID=A0A6A6ZEP6_9PLEO|nr:hypothetical protein CC86DRAFT_388010 [Ophiobolus disseminans]
MYFSTTILALALASSPIFALPVDESSNDLVARAGTYSCKPKDNHSDVKTFTVSQARAEAQAKVGMFKAGKSGDPHEFKNKGDKPIKWGVKGCDKTGKNKNLLYEYPIFWDAAKKEWKKDEPTGPQPKTPLRVVYIEDNGNKDKDGKPRPKVCGVMTHTKVSKEYQGEDLFQKCTK